MSSRLKRIWRFHLPHVPDTIAILPFLFAISSGYLLAASGQMQEIYLSIIEQNDFTRAIIGYVLLIYLSVALHAFYLARTKDAVPRILGNTNLVGPNPYLASLRHVMAALCGLAPQVGLLFGLWSVQYVLQMVSDGFYQAAGETVRASALRIPLDTSVAGDKMAVHDIVRNGYLYLAASFAGILSYILASYLVRRSSRRIQGGRKWQPAIAGIGLIVLAAALYGFPLLPIDRFLQVALAIGPLGNILIQLIAIFVLFAVIAFVSPWWRFFIVMLAVLSIGITAAQTHYEPATTASPKPNEGPTELATAFNQWLKANSAYREKHFKGRPYPVFIVSTQGGGIYAALAAANFLTTLQNGNENFAKHVFAISGVSGGAVGSSTFQAAIAHALQSAPLGTPAPSPNKYLPVVQRTLAQDHLSAAVALLFVDYFEKAFPWLVIKRKLPDGRPIDRAIALELSLSCAYARQTQLIDQPSPGHLDPATATCSQLENANGGPTNRAASKGLGQMFRDHNLAGAAPHLILNTTFAETGRRVAFSNFTLNATGERSLNSFDDAEFRRGDGRTNIPEALSIATAAVASARFPFLMPPYVVNAATDQIVRGKGRILHRWNFVDGGYADNSGAATAGAIMAALERQASQTPGLDVDIRMLVLTDDNKERAPISLDGTSLVDTIAPLGALFNVRSSISSREVRRAEQRFAPTSKTPWRVKVFRLDQENYSLQLGWTISSAKHYFVTLFTTQSDKPDHELDEICRRRVESQHSTANAPVEDGQTITQNRCQMREVLQLLR